MRTKTKKTIAILTGGVLGLAAFASAGLAHPANFHSCRTETNSWEGATANLVCSFTNTISGPQAQVSSQSGTYQGSKSILANLVATANIPAGHTAYAQAQGINIGGTVISTCKTPKDFSTGPGSSTWDTSGCSSAIKHRLSADLDHN